MSPPFVNEAEADRALLTSLAYRMLGDMGRGEELVQEAFFRLAARASSVESPRAFLITVVTRLCLNELGSARARREEARADRLPEPVALASAEGRIEQLERVSMGFLLLLQRLSPAERAVFLLHEVFDFSHADIAAALGKSVPACRKLLERARLEIARGKRALVAPAVEHRRLLHAFMSAASSGEVTALVALLADDAVMISDGGADGRETSGLRNLRRPLAGAARIAAFVVAATARTRDLRIEERELNGQPSVVFWRGSDPFAALLLAVEGGRITQVFFHADRDRLGHLSCAASAAAG